jgi:hypothetical protein
MTEFLRDSGERPILTVQSIPLGLFDYASGNASAAAGTALNFTVTTYPADERLSLWDQLFSIRVDVNDDAHLWPSGASLTNGQRTLRLTNWTDFITSSDTQNIRAYKIRIENSDVDTHTYYVLFKAYTFASAGGSL